MSTKSKGKSKSAKAKPVKGKPKSQPKTKKLLAEAQQVVAKNLQALEETTPRPKSKGSAHSTTEGNLTVVEVPPPEVIAFNMPSSRTPEVESKTVSVDAPKKLSAIDAAARILAESGEPLNCQQMIEQIAAKGYWTSPGGKTPAATLYSSIIREIKLKGSASRFVKTERGKFAPATVS